MKNSETHTIRTACTRDCPDACGMIATVQGDTIVRLQGDPEHPITQGFLCHRTSRFLEQQYDPRRLTVPLQRQGDEFVPVSWEQAFDQIAQKMLQIRDESGPAAILHYRCGGSMGLMKNVTDFFFERFGPTTVKSGDVCTGAGDEAQLTDFGEEDSHDLFDLYNSRTIVLWGKNPFVSQVHLLPILRKARQKGTRIVLIDPVHHRTTSLCDLFIQPRPGGDIALALGVARALFERDQHDTAAADYCDHFEEFRDLALSKSLEEWSQLSDVSVKNIEGLASIYAQRPVATMLGWGMQRRAHGSATIRVVDALAAISGNVGIPGGGASYYYKRRGAFDLSFARGNDVAPRQIPEPRLGRGILEAIDPPIRMVMVTAANPVAMLPDSQAVAEALRTRELTVVVDSFMTDSARCAHLILPTTTMLEEDDLLGAYGHHWLVESRKVVSAPQGVLSDYEIVQQLARRVQMNGVFADDVETWKKRLMQRSAKHGVGLDDIRRTGSARSPFGPQLMFADRKFATPSGRVNLIREVTVDPPVVTAERPMLLMALSTEQSQASQWVRGADQGPLPAVVNPESAPGFEEGDLALLQSEVGSLTVKLKFDRFQRRDVVLVPKGGWLSEGRCANSLILGQETDAGGCAVYYDTPVSLARIAT